MLFFPCFCAPRIKTSKCHLIKKSGPQVFSVRLCAAHRNTILTNKKKSFWESWILASWKRIGAQKKTYGPIFLVSSWCFYTRRKETRFWQIKKKIFEWDESLNLKTYRRTEKKCGPHFYQVTFLCFYTRRTETGGKKWHTTPILIFGLFTSIGWRQV